MNSFIITVILLFCYYSFSNSNIFLTCNGAIIMGRKLYSVFKRRPYAAFCNIAYAEPPIGDLRFKPPIERKFCINSTTHDFSLSAEETCSTSLYEDCLKLSIYMPLSTNKTLIPVLVWIHEHSYFHGPDFFIDEKILVVTVSFRTSILGFLRTSDGLAKGNMGAKDVVIALKWIKQNIHLFLGDSSRITVAGSGIGSTIVASLILSTAAEDLFTRVIVVSGSALSPADYRPYNFELERKLYIRLGGSKHKFNRKNFYEILSNASKVELDWISQGLFDSSEVRDYQSLITSFGCITETLVKQSFINKPPLEVYRSKTANNNVDVMFGFNSLERLNKLADFVTNRKLLKCLNYNFQFLLPFEGQRAEYNSKTYNKIRKRIMDFYFLNGTIEERSLRRYAKYHSDQIIYPLLRQAILHCEASSNNVYLYRFGFKGAFNIEWKSSVPNLNWTGATSGDEICYLFRCKSVNDVYESAQMTAERQFITKLVRLIANFIKNGLPSLTENNSGLNTLKWGSLQRGRRIKAMSLTNNLKMIYLPEEKRMKFWDNLREEFFCNNLNKDEL